ncbi:sporulation integral membrane protein YtvI [Paenibacillus turpanensis]|uniref:sporulation integral membrane protein YtvI n=1 Tax=Paenibacillus turpanensis TaxID=2689078 RepID=UPI001409CE9F|nr:sporulation integral membrane protein YtvI [Paenibacillus turpanensis]
MDKITVNRILRGLWVALVLVIIGFVMYFSVPLVYPFLIAWVVAYMMNPLVNALQKQGKMPRWLSVTISLSIFLGASITIISLAITKLIAEIGYLVQSVQSYLRIWIDEFILFINSEFIQDIIAQANTFYTENPGYQQAIRDNLTSLSNKAAAVGTMLVDTSFDSVLKMIASLPNILAVLVIVVLASFFISKDWYRIIDLISGMFSEKTSRSAKTVWDDLQKALFGYLRAQFILISITAIVVILGLLILRVDYAVTIGLLIGLVDLMPYLGTGAVFVPWIAFSFLYGDMPLGIGLTILYSVILVARQTLEPKVLASSIGLDPLATLIALVVGLNLFGFLGLIIGPVTLVVLMAFYRAGIFRDISRYIMGGTAR